MRKTNFARYARGKSSGKIINGKRYWLGKSCRQKEVAEAWAKKEKAKGASFRITKDSLGDWYYVWVYYP